MLRVTPLFQRQAFEFVSTVHRHHKKPVGSVFQLGVSSVDKLVGCAIVGRPVARHLQDGFTLEVTRLCTDGSRNACSMLYSASWRIARELGYKKLITYILGSESGISLKASGWKLLGDAGGGSWDRPNRSRMDKHSIERKKLYVRE